MQPSQIFDILVPGHEYDALQEDNNRLSKQNQQCFTEIEELKAQIKKFTEKAENTWEQPQQITHLSRTVLLLGRKALTLQKNCEQLKEESRGRQQVKEMEELMAKKQRIWLQKMSEARESEQELRNRLERIEYDARIAQDSAQMLKGKIVKQEEELQLCRVTAANGKVKVELLQSEIGRLQEQAKQKDYLMLNERNLMEEQIGKKKHQLERYQQVLQAKSQELVRKYEELQLAKQQHQEQYKRKMLQLDAQFALKQQERQKELAKSIHSLKQFEVVDAEENDLQSQFAKVTAEADQLRCELAKLKQSFAKLRKKYEDAKNRAEYLQTIYQDPQHMDHGIITVYIRHLQIFRNKLRQIKEPDLVGQVTLKKRQMLQELQKQYKAMMEE